ncbi:MAG: type II toxin-antitoxin system RelE/ParE family toxin [Candidatus Binatia bacterium]
MRTPGGELSLEYLASVVNEDIPRLAKSVRIQVRTAIEKKLTSHPIEFGKPLRYSLKGARRLRVGDWRVIYRIESPDVVLVVKIGHRREIYEQSGGGSSSAG